VLFDADLRLFGLNPAAFYLHHIAVSGVLAAVVYFFLRLWLPPLGAFAGSCLFVMSPCYANNVYLLMTRHYVEGLLWSLCALLLYVKALQEERPLLAWAGAAFYLLAALCKEIYVPLVTVLPFWPWMNLGKEKTRWMPAVASRSLYLAPFVVVALAYTLYRRWMLGVWIGGYGSLSPAGADLATLWGHARHLLMPEGTWTIFVVLVFAVWGDMGRQGGEVEACLPNPVDHIASSRASFRYHGDVVGTSSLSPHVYTRGCSIRWRLPHMDKGPLSRRFWTYDHRAGTIVEVVRQWSVLRSSGASLPIALM
jgi:hypothetical protein